MRRGMRRLDAALSNALLKDCNVVENLHGWRPPSGAFAGIRKISFAEQPLRPAGSRLSQPPKYFKPQRTQRAQRFCHIRQPALDSILSIRTTRICSQPLIGFLLFGYAQFCQIAIVRISVIHVFHLRFIF